jgi:DNA-binding transcriptional MerR regulator
MDGFHTSEEVAARYRTTAGTVRYWRHIGYGPKGVRVGRRVLYSDAALKEFDAQVAAEQHTEPQGAA